MSGRGVFHGAFRDVFAGAFVVSALGGIAFGLQWLWVHGWRWPAYVVGAFVGLCILGVIGSAIMGES